MPINADAVATAAEEFDRGARERAEQRAAVVEANGEEPRANDRGGVTAVRDLIQGYSLMHRKLGLPVDTDDDFVKEIARVGGNEMPNVQPMWPLDAVTAFEEHTSEETSDSIYVRAYSGGLLATALASKRVIDMRRTQQVHVETCKVLGKMRSILCGIANRSKAKAQHRMRALAWRVPIMSITDQEVDMQPMIDTVTKYGAVFPDYVVPAGEKKTIFNAIGWADKAAPHATVQQAAQDIAAVEIGTARAKLMKGHGGRHVLPEVGRAAELPTQYRETLGDWSGKAKVVSDKAADAAVMHRAVRVAREASKAAGKLAIMSNRYASVDGEKVEVDVARVTCVLIARRAVQEWSVAEADWPNTTDAQINYIANMIQTAPTAAAANE